jgi:hypothetical protein
MANGIIMRTVEVTDEYAPLSPVPLIGTVNISALPTNSGPVFFKAGENEEAWFMPGEYHQFIRIPIHSISIKGTAGDMVTIIGGTW